MVEDELTSTTKDLVEALMRMKRLHWSRSPVMDLKHSEIQVLFCIKKCQGSNECGLKLSEISSHMNVTNPTTTQSINGLEEKGYVKRSVDKEDRRAARVVLTEKGEQAVKAAGEGFIKFFEGLVVYLGEEKSILLTDIINEAIDYINENMGK
ncbi:MAG: MarR family winged helix-turn-helix transcriptional regulator [Solirubrobacterales bacterium]